MTPTDGILSSATVLLAGSTEWFDTLATTLEHNGGASVLRADTGAGTLELFRTDTVACVVIERQVGETSAVTITEQIRQENQSTPVVVCTERGSDRLADDALAAGATDYISMDCDSKQETTAVLDRISRAVRTTQRLDTRRERARQFEAIFQNSDDATWVLDADGRVQRANETARNTSGCTIDRLVDEPFWEIPCWTATAEKTRSDLQQFITTAREEPVTKRITTETELEHEAIYDLSAYPVTNPAGTVEAIVVTGTDVTERVSLRRELRESEELHRVTLNNMTDTVLVTNEAGEFTYICPNVYFIFGYSVEEIRDLGTIDELLGEDLFDREELAETGVLKNIECTARDKAGTEHTLLVNVREVNIQDGTLLFSCRDITKRKQREDALTTLHQTTRNLLYAETKAEIAHHLVEDTSDILDVEASAIYLYETEKNRLQPTAYSNAMERVHGPLQSVPTGDESLLGRCFIEDETQFYDDIRDDASLENWQSELRSATIIPLGDHGVFIAGSSEVDLFDDIKREIADLVAATAEAALDRVERESELLNQDLQLQRQNRRLTEVNEINDLIREIDRTLVQAETREEMTQSVCNALTRKSNFAFAWIGEFDSSVDDLTPKTWAGDELGYLDSVQQSAIVASEPAVQAARTGAITTISNVAEEIRDGDWQKHALTAGYQSVISIPIEYDDFQYGVLSVYADTPNAFSDLAQDVLAELGETIALALSALNRKNALLTSGGTQLEFEVLADSFLPLQLARRVGCSLSFQSGLQNEDGGIVMFVTVEDASADDVREQAQQMVAVDDVQILTDGDQSSLLQLRLSRPFLPSSLADHGVILDGIVADPETAVLSIDVPASLDSSPVIRHITETVGSAELVAKRTGSRTSRAEFYATVLEELTDRQLEVVQTAYYSGYFDSPRTQTGEEIAETLDISPPAFYSHTRAVERKLFSTLFEDVGVPS